MNKAVNLQDLLLNEIRMQKTEVTVFLTNGFQIKGLIKGYDNFVVIIESEGKQQMVYKHAISTVVPAKPIHIDIQKSMENNTDFAGREAF